MENLEKKFKDILDKTIKLNGEIVVYISEIKYAWKAETENDINYHVCYKEEDYREYLNKNNEVLPGIIIKDITLEELIKNDLTYHFSTRLSLDYSIQLLKDFSSKELKNIVYKNEMSICKNINFFDIQNIIVNFNRGNSSLPKDIYEKKIIDNELEYFKTINNVQLSNITLRSIFEFFEKEITKGIVSLKDLNDSFFTFVKNNKEILKESQNKINYIMVNVDHNFPAYYRDYADILDYKIDDNISLFGETDNVKFDYLTINKEQLIKKFPLHEKYTAANIGSYKKVLDLVLKYAIQSDKEKICGVSSAKIINMSEKQSDIDIVLTINKNYSPESKNTFKKLLEMAFQEYSDLSISNKIIENYDVKPLILPKMKKMISFIMLDDKLPSKENVKKVNSNKL